jgi:type VII secretion protein EssB
LKVSNGITSIDIERAKGVLQVRLLRADFKPEAVNILPAGVNVNEEEEYRLLSYPLPEHSHSLSQHIQRTGSRLDRLELAQALSSLSELENEFSLPFLHPENLFLVGGSFTVIHFGFRNLMAPMEVTTEEFLKSYQALVLAVMNPKLSYESFVSGEAAGDDTFSQKLTACESLSEVIDCVNQETRREAQKVNQKLGLFSKGRYRFFKYAGIFAIIAALVMGWFTYSYASNSQKQEAVITAQAAFLTDNYAQTQTELQKYTASDLPKSARYILAVSAINLSDLTLTQKQSILNTISPKTDDNTLNYWLYAGRGDFEQALNLAKNLGDSQLTLLAYTNLYDTTKLDTKMNGEKKQKLLSEYSKQIDELTKELKE